MNKKKIDLDRARNTLTKIICVFSFLQLILFSFKPIYYETVAILIFVGLGVILIMDHYKERAQELING